MTGEMWSGPATEPEFGFNAGEVILENVHPQSKCEGRACVLHNPSDHHMRDWPTLLRTDWGIPFMERTCPHGIGHPDPDDLAWHKSQGRESLGVHGCDGCCYKGVRTA